MISDSVAARYAEAFFETAKAHGEVDTALEELRFIQQLLKDHRDLLELFINPGVDADDKTGVLERVVGGSWSELVRSFVQVVIGLGRAEYLPDIVEAFAAAVDKDQRRLRVVVRTAHPLPESMLRRLRSRLGQREGAHIELRTELVPELLGGLQVVLDHRVVDGSVRRQLDELRRHLHAVQVY